MKNIKNFHKITPFPRYARGEFINNHRASLGLFVRITVGTKGYNLYSGGEAFRPFGWFLGNRITNGLDKWIW